MGHIVQEEDYLQHWGVLGMKWGVRKDGRPQGSGSAKFTTKAARKLATKVGDASKKNKELNTKIDKILTKGNKVRTSDAKLFEEQRKPLLQRATKAAVNQAVAIAITDIFTGQSDYTKMSAADKTKRVNAIIKNTVVKTTLNSVAAKSAAKNYDSSGKLTNKRSGIITKEDLIVRAPLIARASMRAAKLGRGMIFVKAEHARNNRAENEGKYKKAVREGRILEDRVDHTIWKSEDGKSSVITNPREGAKDVTPKKKRR